MLRRTQRMGRTICYPLAALLVFLIMPRPVSPTGSVDSEGDSLLRAALARATFSVTGKGVRVGVISSGILGLDQSKATGDLAPGTCGPQVSGVTQIDPNLCRGIGTPLNTDAEGTAIMEIIHDLAPDAELLFCAPSTRIDMTSCIDFLSSSVNIIIDDLTFFGEPYFQDGIVAQAAAGVIAQGLGYYSSAGNSAQQHYQGTYVDSGDGMGSHQISPGNTFFTVTGSDVIVVLQWSNPFDMSTDNYDLCLASESVSRCAIFNVAQNGDDDPIEIGTFFCPTGCDLQVRLVSGQPQILELFVLGGSLAVDDQVAADSVIVQQAVTSVSAIAAIDALDPGNDQVEPFSSRGPSTIVFPAPETRQKPNVAGIDNVLVSGAGGFPDPLGGSPQRFVGTSAAAPHAAAVAALMLEANRSLTPARVQTLLQQTAVPLGPIPNFDTGFGRIDAFAAVQAALPPLLAATLPSSRSVQLGTPATAFATIINAGSETGIGCGLAPLTALPAVFQFQTTDPATNQLTGTVDTPVDIPAGGSQSFVFSFTPSGVISPTDVALNFDCTNTDAARNIVGLNTLLLSASTTPVIDIVALAATLQNNGTVDIPGTSGTGVFAVATVNVGSGGTITASADTGGVSLPVSLALCQTNPTTGSCLGPPAGSVITQIDANATPTFGIFVTGSGTVPFLPATNRIFVRFTDSSGVVRGATSVAVQTQ